MELTLLILDLIGIAVFAASGALAAARNGMDIFGFMVIGLMTAVGGGTVRDVVLGAYPVFWVENNSSVIVALSAAVLVYFTESRLHSRRTVLLWLDAVGLALFAAYGARKTLEFGAGPLIAVMMGIVTAVTGGMLRDVICNEIPLILSREIYATAAFVASVSVVTLTWLTMDPGVALVLATVAGFATRALAILFDWSLPHGRGPSG